MPSGAQYRDVFLIIRAFKTADVDGLPADVERERA